MGIPARAELTNNPELIWLKSGRLEAAVNPHGAFLEQLTLMLDKKGPVDLLTPRHKIWTPDGEKNRGGSHVCFPNFGPGEDLGLNQHGFGRNVQWEVLPARGNLARLALNVNEVDAPGASRYRGLYAIMEYLIVEDSQTDGLAVPPTLTMRLGVRNTTNRPMFISPGFHPYFALHNGERADEIRFYFPAGKEEGHTYKDEQLLGSPMIFDAQAMQSKNFWVETRNYRLPAYTVWTDNPEAYICFEPTAQRALREDKENWLAGGDSKKDSRNYWAQFKWHELEPEFTSVRE